ncbi:MAG: molybdenum cofactor biosynthesis protein MoaE, partial [Candidatus Cloacimonetes bacterium]|nr:molybdenum cofactor biosynthesis protein MoaE [Candidatus Cloacimonadota bacterium]
MVEITKNILCMEDYRHHIYDPGCGAIVSFLGVVRNLHKGREV